MFGRTIWDKLPECIFESFAIVPVKFWNSEYVVTGYSHRTNKHLVPKLISNSVLLQSVSAQLQNS